MSKDQQSATKRRKGANVSQTAKDVYDIILQGDVTSRVHPTWISIGHLHHDANHAPSTREDFGIASLQGIKCSIQNYKIYCWIFQPQRIAILLGLTSTGRERSSNMMRRGGWVTTADPCCRVSSCPPNLFCFPYIAGTHTKIKTLLEQPPTARTRTTDTMSDKNALGYDKLACKTPVPSDIEISQQIVKEVGLLPISEVAKQWVDTWYIRTFSLSLHSFTHKT